MIKFFGACKLCRFNNAGLERLPSHELLDLGKRINRALLCLDQRLTNKRVESHLVIDCFALLLETGEVFTLGLVKKLAEKAFMHLQRLVDEYRGRVEDSGNQCGVTTLRTKGAQMGRIVPPNSRAIWTKRF